jgi:hydrogenase/urease accessory protein HupE
MVMIPAVFHGSSHREEWPSASDVRGYRIGVVLGAGSLHVPEMEMGVLTLKYRMMGNRGE